LDKIKQLAPSSKSHYYTKEQLEEWARKIYANTYVDKLEYHIEGNTLHFIIHEKKEITLNAGLSYNTNYGGSLNLAASIPNFLENITTHLGIKAEVSEFPKIDFSNSFQYHIGKQILYGQGKAFFYKSPLFLYEKGDNTSTYTTHDLGGALSLGTELSPSMMLQYELSHHTLGYAYESGKRNISSFEQNYQVLKNKFTLIQDTSNRSNFSTKGYKIHGDISTINSTDEQKISATALKGNAEIYVPILRSNVTLLSNISVGKISGKHIPRNEYFKIGGNRVFHDNIEFLGAPISSIHSNHYWLWGMGLQYQIFENLNLLGKYNYLEYYDESKKKHHESGYGFGLGFDIFYTPILFHVSKRSHYKSPVWELSLGYVF